MLINLLELSTETNGGKKSKGLYDRLRCTVKGMKDQLSAQELATMYKIIDKESEKLKQILYKANQ